MAAAQIASSTGPTHSGIRGNTNRASIAQYSTTVVAFPYHLALLMVSVFFRTTEPTTTMMISLPANRARRAMRMCRKPGFSRTNNASYPRQTIMDICVSLSATGSRNLPRSETM